MPRLFLYMAHTSSQNPFDDLRSYASNLVDAAPPLDPASLHLTTGSPVPKRPHRFTVPAMAMMTAAAMLFVAEVGIAGRWHSLAVVEGAPAIAYIDSSSSKPALHFVRATNASGSGWGSPLELTESIDNFPHLLTLSRLVSVRGNPAVSFTRRNAPAGPSATSLAYLRARDARGTNWPPPVETGTSGWYMSLAELGNGRAAISFSNPTGGILEFVTSVASEEQVGINWIAVEP